MKKPDWSVTRFMAVVLASVALLAVTAGSSAAAPSEDPGHGGLGQSRVGVCHETGNGFIFIEVSEMGWVNGHSGRGDVLANGPEDCAGLTSTSTSTSQSVTSVSISANPASPQNVGTSVTFTASSSPSISTQYKWWVQAPGSSSWTMLADWGGNSYTWSTSNLAAGTYQIGVWAMAEGSSSDNYQAATQIAYTLNSTQNAALVTPSANGTSSDVGHGNGKGHGRR